MPSLSGQARGGPGLATEDRSARLRSGSRRLPCLARRIPKRGYGARKSLCNLQLPLRAEVHPRTLVGVFGRTRSASFPRSAIPRGSEISRMRRAALTPARPDGMLLLGLILVGGLLA